MNINIILFTCIALLLLSLVAVVARGRDVISVLGCRRYEVLTTGLVFSLVLLFIITLSWISIG
jgi:hypothetical protein